MGGWFYLALNMSVTASLAGLAVLAARPILRRRSALAAWALWAVVLARLLLPLSLPSEASLLNAVNGMTSQIAGLPLRRTLPAKRLKPSSQH